HWLIGRLTARKKHSPWISRYQWRSPLPGWHSTYSCGFSEVRGWWRCSWGDSTSELAAVIPYLGQSPDPNHATRPSWQSSQSKRALDTQSYPRHPRRGYTPDKVGSRTLCSLTLSLAVVNFSALRKRLFTDATTSAAPGRPGSALIRTRLTYPWSSR